MKRESQHSSGGKLRGLFCLGLMVVLAAVIALNTAAANADPVQYDITVRSSFTHTAALSGGRLYFWGVNESTQLPGLDSEYSPQPVQLLDGVADFAISENRTLVVSENGDLTGYGMDPVLKANYPSTGKLIARGAAQVSASDTLAAYVTRSGALYVWGQGCLGKDTYNPERLIASGVKKVSVGNGFGLALMDDGSVYGWGANTSFQTGYEGEDGGEYISEPVKVAENVRDICTGSAHSCVLMEDDSLWTCGDNSFSQTGAGDGFPSNGLTKVLSGVRSVSAGNQHTLAVTKDGSVYVWGYGLSGQLGNHSDDRIETPSQSTLDYVQVFGGCENTFGVTSQGFLESLGNNTNFRLGKIDGTDSLYPARILDKDMNWVYPEYMDAAGDDDDHGLPESSVPEHGAEQPESSEPDVSSEPDEDTGHTGDPDEDASSEAGEPDDEPVDPTPEDPSAILNTFTDVSSSEFYADAVVWAVSNGITKGTSDTTFGPKDPCTRSQAVTFLWRAAGSPKPASDVNPFTDVKKGSFYYDAVLWAVEKGITSGVTSTTFGPDATCPRSQIVTFLYRMEGSPEVSGKNPFTDVKENNFFYKPVLWAVQNGITSGINDTSFDPAGICTRGQIVTFLYRDMADR